MQNINRIEQFGFFFASETQSHDPATGSTEKRAEWRTSRQQPATAGRRPTCLVLILNGTLKNKVKTQILKAFNTLESEAPA